LLAFTKDGHVCVVPSDGSALPRTITDFAGGAFAPVWMPDSAGLIVGVSRSDAFSLLLTDRDGCWPRLVAGDNGGDNMEAAPSPDGRAVVYTHRPFDDLNRWELRLVNTETGQTRPLTGAPKNKDWAAAWSPDGETIAFLSQRSGFTEIWLIRPDGEGLRQLTRHNRDMVEFAWSPDGHQLAATVSRDGAIDLLIIDAESGELRELRAGLGCYAAPPLVAGRPFP